MNLQFYNCFINSLTAKYDMVIAVQGPAPCYSIDTVCERFCAIELQKGCVRCWECGRKWSHRHECWLPGVFATSPESFRRAGPWPAMNMSDSVGDEPTT